MPPTAEGERLEPFTQAGMQSTQRQLLENLRFAVLESSGNDARAPAPSSVEAWAQALLRRAEYEGACATLSQLEGAWAALPPLLGQRMMLEQLLRAPPPAAPPRVKEEEAGVVAAAAALGEWGRSMGAQAICNSYHLARYDERLPRPPSPSLAFSRPPSPSLAFSRPLPPPP